MKSFFYFFLKCFRFLKKNFFKNTRYTLYYGFFYFLPNFKIGFKFFKGEEILNRIKEGKSIIRYGDGEVGIMNHLSLAFQDYDPQIRQGLLDAYKNYSKESPYILGINERAVLLTNEQQKKQGTLQLLLPQKVYARMFLPKDLMYMDASFFYYNENVQQYLVEAFHDREIIFVSRKETLDSIKNNPKYPYLSQTHFIETKEKNAFVEFKSIVKKTEELVASFSSGRKPLVIAAFGAGTKVFAYNLSRKGCQVLDIGTGIEILYQEKRIDGILKPNK